MSPATLLRPPPAADGPAGTEAALQEPVTLASPGPDQEAQQLAPKSPTRAAWWRRLATSAEHVPPARLEVGLQSQRSRAIAYALLAFIVGFSLDDLRVLRLPGYLVGVGLAVALWAFGPLHLGRRFAYDRLGLDMPAFEAAAHRSRRLGSLGLLLAILILAGWLVIFSTGVPPWAR